MKVILLADVPKVGKKYDVKEFKQGYAQNALIARGLAELATPQAMAKLERHKENIAEEKSKEQASFKKLLESLSGKTITLHANANEKGHLFKSIHKKDIAEAIKESLRIDLPEELINLDKPIKETGEREVDIGNINSKVFINIVI